MYKINYKLFFTGTFWGTIGYMRGLNQYEYEYKNGKPNYLYINKITTGLWGCIIYINPYFLPFTIHKEFYRLEINVRGLDEKHTPYYNKILW